MTDLGRGDPVLHQSGSSDTGLAGAMSRGYAPNGTSGTPCVRSGIVKSCVAPEVLDLGGIVISLKAGCTRGLDVAAVHRS